MTTLAPPARGAVEPGRPFLATLLAGASLTIMAAAIIAPGLPAMRVQFAGAPAADVLVRLSLTITSLAIAVSAGVVGAVSDRVGRKPVLITGLVLYAVAGTSGVLAPDLPVLLATRALLGLAVGAIMAAVSATITDLYDGPRRAAVLGLQSAAAGAGGMVFLPLAGVLAGTSWRAPLLLYAVGLLVVPFAVVAVRETRVATAPTATGRAGDARRGAGRALPAIATIALGGTVVFFMAPTQLPFLLGSLGASPTTTGVAVAGSTATSALASLAYVRVRGVLGHAAVVASSLAALGVGWVVVGTASSIVPILAGALVAGIGVGLLVPHLTSWTGESVPARRRGRALGALVSAIFLGQFLSPLVLAPLVDAVGISHAFTVTGALAVLVAAVLPAVLPRVPRT